jgi:predicted DsbA family dithiol-disulfide isomerase
MASAHERNRTLDVEVAIYSDLICPWCFIGKRRIEQVLRTPVGEGVTIRWLPFQLYPNIPPGGVDRQQVLEARYGADADATRIPTRIRDEAADVGLEFDFGAMRKTPNTLDGHRLLELFSGPRQSALMEVLFSYYFQQGADVGDHSVLLDAVAEAGLDVEAAREVLGGDAFREAVLESIRTAYDTGVTGVPSYLLAGRFTIPGAQPPEVLSRFIERARLRLGEDNNDSV